MSKKRKSFDDAKREWEKNISNSPIRNYNFDTLSGKN